MANKNKNAIGVLSVNWISDNDDSLTINFLQKIKVAAIAKDINSEAVKPYQSHILKQKIILLQEVFYKIAR